MLQNDHSDTTDPANIDIRPVKKIGLFRETWKNLKKNNLALFGLFLILAIMFLVIFADFIAPYGIDDQDLLSRFVSPSKGHIFGTDNLGRDIFSRVLYGGRVSLMIGLFSALFSAGIGILFGSLAGFYGGKLDNLIMRGIDIMMAIPSMLLAISIVAALGPGMNNVIIAVGIGMIPGYARIVRASILSVKEQEYIEAARSIGANDYRIIARHILPNCMAPIIVNMTMSVARSILEAASLSFIGLGIRPPSPEWGAMLSAARPYIRDHWHVITFPGLAIMAIIYGLNLFGDGLRDALDPRLKR
jgi:peptide/nickel transport system permease protein